jgi:uncharacterized membrane protein
MSVGCCAGNTPFLIFTGRLKVRTTERESDMSRQSTRLAGILLIVFPTVIYGGVSILYLLVNDPSYAQNQLRQDLWRAGHAHAGVFLVLSLVILRYVDEANLSDRSKTVVRHLPPIAAILLPAAFFFSVLSANAVQPNEFIYLAYLGALLLAIALVWLGVGLLRKT